MTTMLAASDVKNQAKSFPDGFMVTLVAGTASATNITVTGITTSDKIMAVLRLNRDAATVGNIDMDDLTGESSITAANTIQLSTTDTTGDKLICFWYDRS
jgi:hypothetical protein